MKRKVRAYDLDNKKMIYISDIYPNSNYKFEYDAESDYELSLVKLSKRIVVFDEDDKDYVLTQFKKVNADVMDHTGMNDKFGTDIYEKDEVSLKISVYREVNKKKTLVDIERYEGVIVNLWLLGWAIEYEEQNEKKYFVLSSLTNRDYTLVVTGSTY